MECNTLCLHRGLIFKCVIPCLRGIIFVECNTLCLHRGLIFSVLYHV